VAVGFPPGTYVSGVYVRTVAGGGPEEGMYRSPSGGRGGTGRPTPPPGQTPRATVGNFRRSPAAQPPVELRRGILEDNRTREFKHRGLTRHSKRRGGQWQGPRFGKPLNPSTSRRPVIRAPPVRPFHGRRTTSGIAVSSAGVTYGHAGGELTGLIYCCGGHMVQGKWSWTGPDPGARPHSRPGAGSFGEGRACYCYVLELTRGHV